MRKKFFLTIIVSLVVLFFLLSFIFLPLFVKEVKASGNQVNITRMGGDTRFETAVEISKKGWPNGAQTIVIARGDMFPDALAGAPLAGKYSAPLLLTSPEVLSSSTASEISRLHATKAFILGSEDAILPIVESNLRSRGVSEITRLGGLDRYDTAALIGKQLRAGETSLCPAFIVTGNNYPDALSIASIAAYNRWPILLVNGDADLITNPTAAALDSSNPSAFLKINKIFIIGGSDVVPADIEDWLRARFSSVLRFQGIDRYETCIKAAQWATWPGASGGKVLFWNNACFAYGENFPDALSLGPFAGKMGSVILLVRDTFIPASIKDTANSFCTHRTEIHQVYIAGQTDVVSDIVADDIYANIYVPIDIFLDPHSTWKRPEQGSWQPPQVTAPPVPGTIVDAYPSSFEEGWLVHNDYKARLTGKDFGYWTYKWTAGGGGNVWGSLYAKGANKMLFVWDNRGSPSDEPISYNKLTVFYNY